MISTFRMSANRSVDKELVDHQLVIHRRQLLAECERRGMQACAGTTSQENSQALHLPHDFWTARTTPSCRGGSVRLNASCSLSVASREFSGRHAGEGKSVVRHDAAASSATRTVWRVFRAMPMAIRANSCQRVMPLAGR